jgi:hypothetical protein
LEIADYIQKKCPNLKIMVQYIKIYSSRKTASATHPLSQQEYDELVNHMTELKTPRVFKRIKSNPSSPNKLRNPHRNEMAGVIRNLFSPFFIQLIHLEKRALIRLNTMTGSVALH